MSYISLLLTPVFCNIGIGRLKNILTVQTQKALRVKNIPQAKNETCQILSPYVQLLSSGDHNESYVNLHANGSGGSYLSRRVRFPRFEGEKTTAALF